MAENKQKIPRKLHFIWVGDDRLRPEAYIETWRRMHEGFEVKVWNNDDLRDAPWRTKHLMEHILKVGGQYAAIADLMRWEILLDEGGIALDADSVCLKTLPDWLLECDLFAAWENEYNRPGLVANGYVGSAPQHPVIQSIVEGLSKLEHWPRRFSFSRMRWHYLPAWRLTGPSAFTEALMSSADKTATILPSHFFIPIHYSGIKYRGNGPVFACEFFSSTPQSPEMMDLSLSADELVAVARGLLDE